MVEGGALRHADRGHVNEVKYSGVARPVQVGGQALGNAVFQVGKEL